MMKRAAIDDRKDLFQEWKALPLPSLEAERLSDGQFSFPLISGDGGGKKEKRKAWRGVKGLKTTSGMSKEATQVSHRTLSIAAEQTILDTDENNNRVDQTSGKKAFLHTQRKLPKLSTVELIFS